MLRSFLIGLTAGARALTPLAVVSAAARDGTLPADNGAPALLGHPVVAGATKLLAAGEWLGDKQKSAPDRIVAAGIAARLATGAIAGAALAPKAQRVPAAALGAAGAVGSAYLTFAARMWALRRFGQGTTGVVEDALTLAAARRVAKGA